MEYEINDVAEETRTLNNSSCCREWLSWILLSAPKALNVSTKMMNTPTLVAFMQVRQLSNTSSIEFRQNGLKVHLKVLSSSSPTVMSNWSLPLHSTNLSRSTHSGFEFCIWTCQLSKVNSKTPSLFHGFLRFKAPKDKGPKNVRVFMNQPTTIDFDKAVGMTSTQVKQINSEEIHLSHFRILLWPQHNWKVASLSHWSLSSSKMCRIFNCSSGT